AMSLLPSPLKSWVLALLWTKTHAAPSKLLSCGPPTMAVRPSPDKETEAPCPALPTAPVPTSLCPYWVQIPPPRLNTHAAPLLELSSNPPMIAVLPSADSATDELCLVLGAGTALVLTNLASCWVQFALLRVKTHAAPSSLLSSEPPTM